MAKWFVRNQTNKNISTNEKPGVKVVHLDIDCRKSFSKLINDVTNESKAIPTTSKHNSRGNANYYDKIDVVDVKTLKYDIKKLLLDSNAKIAHEKLGKVLQSVDVVSKQCENMTARLSQYEDRIKCLESRSTTLNDKNKQLEMKIKKLEKFVAEAEILNENTKNSETALSLDTCKETIDGTKEDSDKSLKDDFEKGEKSQSDMKVRILLWQMRQKLRATYKYKSKDAKRLISKDDNMKTN